MGALAKEMLSKFQEGFANNNHKEIMGDMFADNLKWDWSDGTKGEGSKDEIFAIFSKTWGFMVSSFIPAAPLITVDHENGVICISTPLVINIDGGMPEANLINNSVCFVMKVADGKFIQWDGYWDNKYPPMLEAMGKVMAKLESNPSPA